EPSERVPGGGDEGIRVIGLGFAGRLDEAKALLGGVGQTATNETWEHWRTYLAAWLDRRVDDMISMIESFPKLKIFEDPEAVFQEGWLFCDVGQHARGIDCMRRAVARGYFPAATLTKWPQFDPIRDDPEFVALRAAVEAGRQRAREAFRAAGGEQI